MSYLPIFLATELTLSEKLALSGEMLLRGMGTVFMVLILLWGILSLFKVFSTGTSEKNVEKKTETVAPVAERTPVPATAVNENKEVSDSNAQTDDAAVIAAICAAIEAYRSSEGLDGLPYRVVSFKRKTGRKSWLSDKED